MRKALLLLLLCLSPPGWAQIQINQFPAGLVKLTDGWRYQKGDNPAWADPRYDDSGWPRLRHWNLGDQVARSRDPRMAGIHPPNTDTMKLGGIHRLKPISCFLEPLKNARRRTTRACD